MTTQGQTKMLNYFNEALKSDLFAELRKKYNIPSNGFEKPDGVETLPNKWAYKNDEGKIREIENDVDKLCRRYYYRKKARFDNQFNVDFHHAVLMALFYGRDAFPYQDDVCKIRDLTVYPDNPRLKPQKFVHPVAITIASYASERDVIDFIKKNFTKRIKPILDFHIDPSVKIGKFKTKKASIEERNQFIYDNKELPHEKIQSEVKKRFGKYLEYTYIAKIISIEKKRRKEV